MRSCDMHMRRMHRSTNFVIDVGDPEVAGHFDGRDEGVRDSLLERSGVRAAAYLNLQIPPLHELPRAFSLQDLVLQRATLNRLPIRLCAIEAEFLRRRRKTRAAHDASSDVVDSPGKSTRE